jgi:hypothetical protein
MIASIAFSKALVRLVILIGLRTLTVLFFMSIDVNKHIADAAIRISRKVCSSLIETPLSLAADVRKCAERSDRSDTTFRTLGLFHTVLY